MSVQTYKYEAHFNWKWDKQFDAWAIQDEATVKANLTADFKTAFLSSFAAKMAQLGHWYKMNDVVTNFTAYSSSWGLPLPLPMLNVHAEGETIITFESDVQDASAHASPQLWQAIQDLIKSVLSYLAAHPEVVVFLLAVGILAILAIWLINTGTGAINRLGGDIGSLIITVGILAVAGLGIYALFMTTTGRRAASKGYQVARRGYHAARRRLR
jgi:hypothetical protein